ncbi:nephrin isoform X2 [Schistocerca gregaria]|uniref:nephrin isoform X2 n=1 Tax=Schistocerca gregaria TaxID=7010 RepID=UPI00211DCD79|nr:nephrin isoform X2 [Schistocerca gregaria]
MSACAAKTFHHRRRHGLTFVLRILVLAACAQKGASQQQYFRILPKDVRVHEGGEAVLECEVSNLGGRVQWTKDGFALGFSSVIPGFPRYSVMGDARAGVFNLRISNATLDDDAEFQCQVGPARLHKAIRANARLTVISPPSSIEIVDHPPNSKIEIKENEEFELVCQVKNSKPAAKIIWYRGNVELKLEKRVDTTTEVNAGANGRAKRYNVLSRIKLRPTAEDDYADYTCEARHEALPPDMPLRVTVQLSVLYPPGVPYIEGYTEGEVIRRGQTVELVCRSRGGNPPAQLIWYKNGEQIRMAYRTAGRLSENVYSFTADASDNNAHYRCQASNIMSPAPLKADVTLTVLFAPAQVSISGPTEARAGDEVQLTCTTANSNPPAEIKWMVGGRHVRNATQRVIPSPDGGHITTSNITVTVAHNRRSVVVICHGLNMQLTENVVSTHTINVLHPPGPPIIQGYTEGSIHAGTVQKISCISSGGNPLATLTWYKNDKKISSTTKVSDRSVSAEITILTNVSDNEARYRCEASNSATEIPLFQIITLNVYFPPDHVVIRKEPEKLTPGVRATLTCDSSSSNPEAELSWWREGIAVPGVTNVTRPGLHGGKVSSIMLNLDVTPELDGNVYTCQATNTAMQRSVHDAFTLHVFYKPVFEEAPKDMQTGVEGESLVLSVKAKAHPGDIVYTWTKDGNVVGKSDESRIITEGPVLNITQLQKDDAGSYSCEAINSEGATSVTINVTVQYAAIVREAPESIMVAPGEDAHLYCVVDGNPLAKKHITWKHKAFSESDMKKRTSSSFRNGTSYLDVLQPTRADNGLFSCIANNGIGKPSSKDVHLIVMYKPEIDNSPMFAKGASNTGDTGRLTCRASGAPKVRFAWAREGSPIPTNTDKYDVQFRQVDLVTYESALLIHHVRPSDYGNYECIARNNISFATVTVRLDVTSAPDTPSALTVLNVTHDSVTVSWVPGFDGGVQPTYRIRYRPTSATFEGYKYVDVTKPDSNTYAITGLDAATDYTISIMAFNKLGASKYLPDLLRAKTSSGPPGKSGTAGVGIGPDVPDALLGKADVPRLVIVGVSVTGALLVLFNIALVACFVYRKRAKGKRTAASEQSSSKSATIEMYAPSSYNETVTGETLSSVSEKSESYSNGDSNQEYLEDNTKPPAASTYLIDQMEYPYQYPAYEVQHQPKPHHEEGSETMNRNTYNPSVEGAKLHYATLPPPPSHADGPYYNISPDARYVAYPPQLEFAHLTGSLRRPTAAAGMGSAVRAPSTVPPPDVTVSHNPPPVPPPAVVQNGPTPLLSTFNPNLGYPASVEAEGHLV